MNVETLYPDNKTVSKASPATGLLNVLLAVIWWVGWAFLVIFTLMFFYVALVLIGAIPAQGFDSVTPMVAVLSLSSFIIIVLVFLTIVAQLRQICKTLLTGDPFVPENAYRLRTIWIAVALGEVLRLAFTFIISKVSQSNPNMPEVAADLRIYVWFMVLALIILAEVFREGARLRQEAKLTV